jgi:hypothetical protein
MGPCFVPIHRGTVPRGRADLQRALCSALGSPSTDFVYSGPHSCAYRIALFAHLVLHRTMIKCTYLMAKKKNPAAVQLGRKGGKASAAKLTEEQRKEKARKAAQARWSKRHE